MRKGRELLSASVLLISLSAFPFSDAAEAPGTAGSTKRATLPPAPGEPVIEGLGKILSSTQKLNYDSYQSLLLSTGPVGKAYLERASDGTQAVEWESPKVPMAFSGKRVAFVIGCGFGTNLGVVTHQLYVNGTKLIGFKSGKREDATCATESVQLFYDYAAADDYGDSFGVMYISLPPDKITYGKPVRFKVVGAKESSSSWFILSDLANNMTFVKTHAKDGKLVTRDDMGSAKKTIGASPKLEWNKAMSRKRPLRSFYVDDKKGDDSKDGRSLKTAWKTIGKANKSLQPGDAVYIRAGTYTNQGIKPAVSGTPGKRITYSAYKDEAVVVTETEPWAVYLKGKSHIHVHGITFRRCGRMLYIMAGSTYNEVSQCTFDQYKRLSDGRFEWGGSRIWDSSYNWIHHCTFSRWGFVNDEEDDKGADLDIGWHKSDVAHHNLVEDCVLFYGGHHILGISGNRNVVRNNYLHNERWMPNPKQPDKKHGNRCITFEKGKRNLVENNRLAYAGPPPDDDGAYGLECTSQQNILRRNLLYANGTAGMGLHSKRFGATDRNYVYFNTFYQNGVEKTIKHFHKSGISIQNYGSTDPKGNVIKNNIFYKNFTRADGWHKQKSFAIGGKVRLEDQVISDNWKDVGDPRFVDATIPKDPFDSKLPDLRLQAGSPCIDKGGWLTSVTSPSGTGKTFTVKDANYFMDGWHIVEGDLIQMQGKKDRARITSVNYDTNTITVDKELKWTQGTGVSLAYEGKAPDMGAHEHKE